MLGCLLNNNEYTPLELAAANGHTAVVEIIIKKGKGADANVSAELGRGPCTSKSQPTN